MDNPLTPIITIMLTPSSSLSHRPRYCAFACASAISLTLLALAGCAHRSPNGRVDAKGQPISLPDAVSEYGKCTISPGFGDMGGTPAAKQVVVIKDRHATHGAITRTRGPLRRVQTQNQAVVSLLVERGYGLMGCESPLGPLPTDTKAARAHRTAAVRALHHHDRLEGLTLYQPILYEEKYRDSLIVLGVEDPELYAADKQNLIDINRFRLITGRNDVPLSDRREARKGLITLVRAITRNATARGQKAAENLIDLMAKQERTQAILLIGGAHATAASATLQAAGINTLVFECKNYHEGLK